MSYHTSDNDTHHDEHLQRHPAAASSASRNIHYYHSHDRRHIQPATTEFSLLNQTTHSQANTTPNQKSASFQQSSYPESNFPEELSDGGVPLYSAGRPYASSLHSQQSQQPKQMTPLFSKRVRANSAIRRTPQASSLVSSPPRPGHSACMRQIFHVSSIGRALPRNNESVSYPLLPNLSPTPSPVKQNNQTCQALKQSKVPLPTTEVHLTVPVQERGESPTPLSSSSESWSGDSGYFIPGAAARDHHKIRPQSRAFSRSSQHIDQWLSSVSPEDDLSPEHPKYATGTPPPNDVLGTNPSADLPASFEAASVTRNPQLSPRREPKNAGAAKLSPSTPLSPNVRLTRGSSCSRSRDAHLDTPTKTKRSTTSKRVLRSSAQTFSIPTLQASPRKGLEGKENSHLDAISPADTTATYEWHASRPTASRALLFRSNLSRGGQPARARMRGAGRTRGML